MSLKIKFLFVLVLLVLPTSVLAKEFKEQSAFITIGNDFYSAGGLVELKSEVEDDAYLAGAVVNVSQKVENDLVAAGSTLTITSAIGDDLRVAGSVITLISEVGGDVVIAGGVVNVLEDSIVAGDASIIGGLLNFSGKVDGDLQLVGDEINFSGQVGGDVEIRIGEGISFSENAKITGKLIYFSKKEIEIPIGIAASIERKDFKVTDLVANGGVLTRKLFTLFVGFIAGAALLALCGKSSEVFANIIRKKLWWSLLAGSLTLFVPFLVILLLVTVVGSYLAGILLAAWVFALLISGALMGFLVGSLIIKQNKETKYFKKLLTLVVGLLMLFVIGFIPGFGGILRFTIFVLTLGALVLSKLQLYKAAKKAKLV